MTIAKVSPYEAHLAAAADEVIRLRTQLADCCPELTARKCALLGLFAGVPLGFVLGVCL